jgi:tight adherence protein C
MFDLQLLLIAGGVALAAATLVFLALDVPLAQAPTRGARGFARDRARDSGFFGPFEPVLRLLATHVARLPITTKRAEIDRALVGAGELRGLTPDEFIVVSALSSLLGIAAAAFFYFSLGGTIIPLACLLLGPLLPTMQLRSRTKERFKAIDRGLPAAIDLASLCMGAGLDFPGAIAHVVANMPDKSSPVRQELERVLQEISLGRTRKQALQGLADRVQTDSVKEFVAAVVQAEEKGTPISVVLSIQATALRGRRSVLAEEAAARAGVMLMLPMLMIMIAIVLLLMGPLFIEMSQGAV